MVGHERQFEVSFIWVLVNFIGIITGTLVAFFLYTSLAARYEGTTLDQARLLFRLGACGAAQGFVVSGLQTVVLLLSQGELLMWLSTNVFGMALGMMAPTLWAIAIQPDFEIAFPFSRYVVAGWLLSWMLSGLLGGWMLGNTRHQRMRWCILTAGAYLYWGLATGLGMKLLEDSLQEIAFANWVSSLLWIGLMLTVGAWLHSYVFRGIARIRFKP